MRPLSILRAGSRAVLHAPVNTRQNTVPARPRKRPDSRIAAALLAVLLLPMAHDLAAQQGYYGPQYAPPAQPYGYSRQPMYPQQPYSGYPQQPYPNAAQPYPQQQAYAAPYPQRGYPAQPQAYPEQAYGQQVQGLDAARLEQLAAPIALYPDTLVAQILAASTYPAQVVEADRWLQTQGNASPYQIAGAADVQSWDPSVKALTAFPQVLAELDRNLRWTTDLGNAYYNQPQDLFEAVQVLRQRAQAAGNLQNTPQEQVLYRKGAIELAPANPQVVYVPAYNPWSVYGDPVAPYPGFSLLGALGSWLGNGLRFGAGIALSAFTHTTWGWMGWALSWLSHLVLFNHSGYVSHSPTVADWGLPGGGARAFAGGAYGGAYRGATGYARSSGGYARPALEAYNRTPAPVVRPRQSIRPAYPSYGFNAYGSSSYANSRGAEQAYSAPAQSDPRADLSARGAKGYGDAYSGNSQRHARAEKPSGSHLFGGGGEPKYKEPKFKAPKEPKFKQPKMSGSHSGAGHSSGKRHG